MADRLEIITLHQARNVFEAKLVLGLLQARGVPAYVAGELLADEFAMSQKLLGLQSVTIQVPRPALARARRVLEEARAAGQILQAGPDADDEGPADPPR